MNDPRETRLSERLHDASDRIARPEGWADVARRAEMLRDRRSVTPRVAGGRRVRWGTVGSVAAVGVFVAVIAGLLLTGGDHRQSTPATLALPTTVRYVTIQTEKFTTARGRVTASINVEHDIDLTRRIARHWAVDWPLDLQPRMIEETITTDAFVYEKIPEERVAQNGGKRWVRYPATEPWAEPDEVARLVDPVGTSPSPPTAATLNWPAHALKGVAGQYAAEYAVDGITTTLEFTVDASGRLLRSRSTTPSIIDDSPKVLETTVLFFDEPVTVTEPALGDVIDVPSVVEAREIIQ